MAYLKEHEEHVAEDGGFAAAIFTMTNYYGTVEVSACVKCDHVEVQCIHESNTWHDKEGNPLPSSRAMSGVTLLCNLCGADGT